MNPHQINELLLFIIVGIPVLTVFGGPFFLHMGLALIALVVLGTWPLIGFTVLAAWLLRKPLRWLLMGIFFGEGLRLSGVFGGLSRRPRRERAQRYRRVPRDYRPNDDYQDDFPSNLEGRE